MSTQLDQRHFTNRKKSNIWLVVMSIKHNICVFGSDVDVTYWNRDICYLLKTHIFEWYTGSSCRQRNTYICIYVYRWKKWPLMKTFFLLPPHVLYSLILLCPCTLIVCVCMHVCGKRERETEREPRAANGRRWSEGQANASEKESKRDRTPQGCREREKKKCIIVKRTIIWRFTVGRRSGVGWWWWRRSLLFFLSCITFLSLSLSFALHATSGLSGHTTLPILLTTTRFFFAVLLLSL
jgi:hypothetical protein